MILRPVYRRPRDRYAGITVDGVRYTDPVLDAWRGRFLAVTLRAGQDSGWRLAVLTEPVRGGIVTVAIERTAERAIEAAALLARQPMPVFDRFLRKPPVPSRS
jgi:hypothetical protein